MISDADYFYTWQLFTLIFFLFQAVIVLRFLMLTDILYTFILYTFKKLVQKVVHKLFKKVVQYCTIF